METLTLGGLNVRAIGPADGATVLLCHGFGAPGDDLMPLAEALDPQLRWRWVFPEGPIDLRPQGIPGRAWWHIDMMRLQVAMMRGEVEELVREMPEGLPRAHQLLSSAIEALGVPREKLVVGGFSQGAMLTTHLALNSATPLAGLAILSGALVAREEWQAAAKTSGPQLSVFQSHGTADPILPFEGALMLRELLLGAGAKLRFVEHDGGHEIPFEALRGLRDFLQARLG